MVILRGFEIAGRLPLTFYMFTDKVTPCRERKIYIRCIKRWGEASPGSLRPGWLLTATMGDQGKVPQKLYRPSHFYIATRTANEQSSLVGLLEALHRHRSCDARLSSIYIQPKLASRSFLALHLVKAWGMAICKSGEGYFMVGLLHVSRLSFYSWFSHGQFC